MKIQSRQRIRTTPMDPEPSAPAAPTRAAIADDSVLRREGIARLLAESGFETCLSVNAPRSAAISNRSAIS
jgi:hypothetical protein